MKRYLIMAGGTGGHIFPALAVAEVLQDKGNEVIWLGSQDSMEERLLPKYGFPLEIIPMKGLRGKPQFDEEDEMHPAFDDDEEEEEEEEDDE